MHPFLRPSLAGSIAIVSVAILGAFALLVFIPIGGSPKVWPMATAAPQAINQNAPVIALTEGEVHEPQVPVTTTKSDRLPSPLGSLLPPSPPTAEVAALKPAEAFDYAQAEAEKKVRRAHAEAPDLCHRHGMHKVWTKDGKSWRCRR
jgi:hypothetical protein